MDKTLEQIRKKLGHLSMQWSPQIWLNTGLPYLNEVIGHTDKGIPYGRIIEIFGLESAGKTAITLALAALAQRDGAYVIWADLESSFQADWAILRGLQGCTVCAGKGVTVQRQGEEDCSECLGSGMDTTRFLLIKPYVGTFGNEKTPRMSTAQELCTEMETAMAILRKKHDRMVLVMDSLPSLLPEDEAGAGLEGLGMPETMSLPKFLKRLLRRWVGLAQNYNMLIVLINQMYTDPMARFGDHLYTPCGRAPKFYSHVRVRVKRVPGSRIVKAGKQVGIKGLMRSIKNKAGGLENSEVGYRLLFQGPIEFVPVSEVLSVTKKDSSDAE